MQKPFDDLLTELENVDDVIALAKEEALLPLVGKLFSTIEAKGYKNSDLMDALATYAHKTNPERSEVVRCFEDAAKSLRQVEE